MGGKEKVKSKKEKVRTTGFHRRNFTRGTKDRGRKSEDGSNGK